MKVHVDPKQRAAKMRAHTATHLLHFALDRLLDGTKQAGSLVDEDYLRFDFAAKKPLSDQQLHQIESQINHRITHTLPVTIQEMPHDQAIQHGAKAFFEDKYGDIVRVVTIRDQDVSLSSVELCGGTHVTTTGEIGACKIIQQESVASGIRRIIAVTGPKVALHAQRQEKQLHQIANKIDCQPKQIEEKIDKLLSDQQELTSRYTKLQNSLIQAEINKAFSGNTQNVTLQGRPRKVYIYDLSDSPLNNIPFKQVVRKAKQLMPDQAWMIINDQGNYALHLGGLKISAKEFLAEHDLRGGGSDTFVQGKDKKVIKIVLKKKSSS